jgi:hypothetical protein
MSVAYFVSLVGAAAATLLSGIFALLFYGFYWQHRALFNSEGRYFDPTADVVYHEEAVVLAVPAAICLCVALLSAWFARRAKRQRAASN